MKIIAAFIIFILCIALSIIFDISMIIPLCIGFILFAALSVEKGFSVKQVLRMAADSLHDSLIVVAVLLLIGCLTGLWRLSGTVAFFVNWGVTAMPPSMFILAAFLVCSAMSFAIGTSFGVTATAGVIMMSIARAGGIPVAPVAGAILSGVYVGDRGSPASSAANLVAALTKTDIRHNIRKMFKTALIPFAISCAAYALLSIRFPMAGTDSSILDSLNSEFSISWICVVPALLMIILPFCRVKIKTAMLIDIAVSAAVAVFAQKASAAQCLSAAVFGYRPENMNLAEMLSGGGLISMAEVCGILLISGTYGRIFQETELLAPIYAKLDALKEKAGRFPAMIVLSTLVCMVFCNQTIGAIMVSQLSDRLYGSSEEERYAKMIDIEDSVIMIAGLIPWVIACSVPLAMVNAGFDSLWYAFFLWLIPICAIIRSRNVTDIFR